jgi:phosphoribosylamine--glycine ligase
MKVLVVGNGGREHALVWKIRQSPLVKAVYCAPGNAGIAALATCLPIDVSNLVELADFAESVRVDLTVVGPELPMVLGLADEFRRRGLRVFCPTRAAAEIEGSKVFAREFMRRHEIPSPRFELLSSYEEAQDFVRRAPFGFPLVLKADGLASGKGTVLAADREEALAAVATMMRDRRFGTAGERLVAEEFLSGEEVSFLVLSDGARAVPLVSAQDHKRAHDGDTGPNTGGMGAVSPATSLSLDLHKQVMQEVILPTIAGLEAEERRYQGVLYAGLMLTEQGPRVLEFNARFGDPETQVILARMKSDLVPVLQAVAEGAFDDTRLEWAKDAAACVVLAAKGYPGPPQTGHEVLGLDLVDDLRDVMAFHAATARHGDKVVTVGGRVLGITALAATLDQAVARAYAAASLVSFEGMHYRRDIGQAALARLHGEA